MKNLTLIALAFTALCSTTTFAKAKKEGAGSSGGGDMCEDRIKIVRDDIKDWINKGGAKGLKLPSTFSKEQYEESMLEQIQKAKIKCVDKGDAEYPVVVYGTPKTCRFDLDEDSSLITCDTTKFMKLSESQQYKLVHHEFAGLSSIEVPNKDDSDYSISDQIEKHLVNVVTKKLAVQKIVKENRFSIDYLPQKSVLKFPINQVLNAGESRIELPRAELGDFSIQCILTTESSHNSRKLDGTISYTIRSIYRENYIHARYQVEGDSKLNNKKVNLKMICSGFGDIERLYANDLATYFESLGGSLTVAPSVEF